MKRYSITDFNGGVNNKVDPAVLPDNVLTAIQNYEYRDLNGLKKRYGTQAHPLNDKMLSDIRKHTVWYPNRKPSDMYADDDKIYVIHMGEADKIDYTGVAFRINALAPQEKITISRGTKTAYTVPYNALLPDAFNGAHSSIMYDDKLITANTGTFDDSYVARFNDLSDLSNISILHLEDVVNYKYKNCSNGNMVYSSITDTIYAMFYNDTTGRMCIIEMDKTTPFASTVIYEAIMPNLSTAENMVCIGNYIYFAWNYNHSPLTDKYISKLDVVNRVGGQAQLISTKTMYSGTFAANGSSFHCMQTDGTNIYYTGAYLLNVYDTVTDNIIRTVNIGDALGVGSTIAVTDDACFVNGYLWIGFDLIDPLPTGRYAYMAAYNLQTNNVIPIGGDFIESLQSGVWYNDVPGTPAKCFGAFSDGTWIYGLIWADTQRIFIINPHTFKTYYDTYTETSLLGYNELAIDTSGYMYLTKWTDPNQSLTYGNDYLFQVLPLKSGDFS